MQISTAASQRTPFPRHTSDMALTIFRYSRSLLKIETKIIKLGLSALNNVGEMVPLSTLCGQSLP